MIRIILFLNTCFIGLFFLNAQEISIGNRINLPSKILQENRPISIYLPPSYYTNKKQKFPVLYILDGDYNFRYVSGILELQGGIAENIPEMILIGISGKDTEKYRKNCKPNIKDISDKGNADTMFSFIEKELTPYVDKKYRTANYNILAGHSVGGLFVVYASLKKPKLFNNYIAISPSLWWENNAIIQIAKETIYNNPDFKTNTYISLANEKGMKVSPFLKTASNSIFKNDFILYLFFFGIIILAIILFLKFKKQQKSKLYYVGFPVFLIVLGIFSFLYVSYFYYPENTNYKFKQFTEENHNSVGEPTYIWSLNEIFNDWKFNDVYVTNSAEIETHFNQVKNKFGNSFNLSKGVLANTVRYILKDNKEELNHLNVIIQNNYPDAHPYFISLLSDIEKDSVKARKILINGLTKYPNSIDLLQKNAILEINSKHFKKADSLLNITLKTALSQKIRQWQINEIIGLKDKITNSQNLLKTPN